VSAEPLPPRPLAPAQASQTAETRQASECLHAKLRHRRRSMTVAAMIVADAIALALAAGVAIGHLGHGRSLGWTLALLAVVPAFLFVCGMYRADRIGPRRRLAEVRSLLPAVVLGCLAFAIGDAVPLEGLAIFGATLAGALVLLRAAVCRVLALVFGPVRVLLVGDDSAAECFAPARMRRHDAVFVMRVSRDADLNAVLDEASVDHVVADTAAVDHELISACSQRSLRLNLVVTQQTAQQPRVITVTTRVAEAGAVSLALKRAMDVVGAGFLLLLLSPLLLFVALAVRAGSPGGALFRQLRVGRRGGFFVLWKFRTMVVDAEAQRAALLARSRDPNWLHLDDDPRITTFGRFLRRSSIDELPQLWNVLRGDMSLVGPRPLIPAEHDRVAAWARRRSDVRPGITGLWQVAGRTDVSFEDMLRLDCVYAATWSLRDDVDILVRTVPAALTAKGAN
jgi:lipopolysaccharide/colanic/teichoic acid biosynthesis glycosyltransferase